MPAADASAPLDGVAFVPTEAAAVADWATTTAMTVVAVVVAVVAVQAALRLRANAPSRSLDRKRRQHQRRRPMGGVGIDCEGVGWADGDCNGDVALDDGPEAAGADPDLNLFWTCLYVRSQH